ncbi:DUF6734 family protein [uncultured Aquimarina sp.]|uniref:DUF6734 family protein n=1 Tax=uncultured Aquimarina sp. TaxID=575652 RepID=UPI0026079B77|nr:DUF6734 family protein [uncultured Aquimarina sp.]
MRIVQSFWSGGVDNFNSSYGWLSSKYHWIGWILSSYQLAKYHKNVELYTDSFGKKILIDYLNLPYTKVHVVFDDLDYHKDLWAIGKIKTYQLQKSPFIHVDGDVFVWESIDSKFEKSPLIAQNLEVTTAYYGEMWNNIAPNLDFISPDIENYNNGSNNYACNMGIVGGHDISFFHEYTSKSIEFVNKNKHIWNEINAFNFNIFFEQVLFYELAMNKKIEIDFLFNEISEDNNYKGFGDFNKVPDKTYLHLLGVYKRNPSVCKAMEIYVMKYYPETYSILMNIINNANGNDREVNNLSKDKINSMCLIFRNDLIHGNNFTNRKEFIVARDLFNEGLPIYYDGLISNNKDFWLINIEQFNLDEDILSIEELNEENCLYDLDEIDKIIMFEINNKRPILFSKLTAKLMEYIDKDNDQEFRDFNRLIKSRIRNYIQLKIITLYN